MPVDLAIKGGTLVTTEGSFKAGVAIDDGRIVAISSDENLPKAERVIDAEGLHVLPGVIDPHVHFRDPGLTYKEDFKTGTQAAAAGGVTCVFDMPNTLPPTQDPSSFREKLSSAKSKAVVDFGILGVVLPTNLDQIIPLAEAGVIGYKIFMGETVGNLPSPDDWDLIEAFKTIAKTGLRVGVHAENRSITTHLVNALKQLGRTDALAHLESRPSISEAEAMQRAILFTRPFGTKLHIFHMSSKEGVEIMRECKAKGWPITAETGAHYLLLNDQDMKRLKSLMKMNPPIRTSEHAEALWEGLRDGSVDMLASDHSPHSVEEKIKENIWEAIAGFPGVETTVPLILTEVNRGRLSLNQFVKLTSENPAKAWSVYPKKGALLVGSDGDLTIVDLKREGIIRAEELHSRSKITPFDGRQVKGMPLYTIVRGKVVMEEGRVIEEPIGELVTRHDGGPKG